MIYYFLDDDTPLFALLIYGKDEQDDLSSDQKKGRYRSRRRDQGPPEGSKRKDHMSKLGDDLIEAMQEAASFMDGNPGQTTRHVVDVPTIDVAAVRRKTGLSRSRFAARFGLDPRALQEWEQGRRRPDRAARLLLRIIERHPEVVEEAASAA